MDELSIRGEAPEQSLIKPWFLWWLRSFECAGTAFVGEEVSFRKNKARGGERAGYVGGRAGYVGSVLA